MGKICCQEEKERVEKNYIHSSNKPVEKQEINNNDNNSNKNNSKNKEIEKENINTDNNITNDGEIEIKENKIKQGYILEIENKKDNIKGEYFKLKEDLEIKYNFDEYELFLKNIDSKIIHENEIESIFMNYSNIKKKIQVMKDIKNEIEKERDNLEIIKSKKQNDINSIYIIIEQKFQEMENSIQTENITKLELENNLNYIIEELNKLKEINNKLESYESQIKTIEKQINNKLDIYIEVKEEFYIILENIKNEPKLDEKFLKNSMLIYIPEIKREEPNININKNKVAEVLINNWTEKCFVKDEYDMYEVNFEYEAVGLQKGYFPIEEIPLAKDRIIEILKFTINDKNIKYTLKESKLKFEQIKLRNNESIKIYLEYKKSRYLDEGQKRQRKIYKEDIYGISANVKGRNAVFNLIIQNDMEIVSFDEEIFEKINDNEYKFEGLIPNKGKKTKVVISKKNAKYNVCFKKTIKSTNKKPISNTKLTLHYYFEEGGNKNNTIKINKRSIPSTEIKTVKEKRQYLFDFKIKQSLAEVIIEGEIINNCSGEWICDLTEEQIEKEIPEDFKKDKETLKNIANNIIKEYNEIHIKDLVQVTDIAKIGKWVKENIKYDENYKEKTPSSALEIYNNKKGLCKQITILFNALLYSLEYKCIYISGFAIKNNDGFGPLDAHAWSLVRINGKWLPFDATWGIFSGKLPVGHIFEDYFLKTNKNEGTDKLEYKYEISGKFIE